MKKFLSKFDLFPASPILRANGQTQVVNLCGSLFSLCIFGFFTYIFISNIISTVKLENIDATEIIQTKSGSNDRIGNITIGIGIQQQNLSTLRHIFQVRAVMMNQYFQETVVDVFPCTRAMWSVLDDTKYKTLNLHSHMCLQRDNVTIFGENGAPELNLLYFNLSKCRNATSPVPCASSADIDNYFATRLSFGRFFACSLLILDTGLNPTKQNPYTYSVYQKTLWLLFNEQQQILGQIFLGTYELTTDTNFLPIKQQNTNKGYFVSQATITTLINVYNLSVYVEFYIFASPLNKKIYRTYGKFDSILSYVGGLYGIVLSFFAFFVASYNQYRYQLRVSQGAFSFDDGHLARESDLHFGKYLKYVAFDWIKTLTCHEVDWKDCKAIDQARGEAIEQIDVKHLLKRISHLQKIMSILIKDEQETAMFMAQSNSISEVRRRRKLAQYCQKFTEANQAITINNFDQVNAILSLGYMNGTNENLGNKIMPADNINTSLYQLKKTENVQKEDINSGSLHIMSTYLEMYQSKFESSLHNLDLNQQDLEAELELMQAFYELPQETRLKLIKKIPLGILHRLHLRKNKKQQSPNRVLMTEFSQNSDKQVRQSRRPMNRQSLATLENSAQLRK